MKIEKDRVVSIHYTLKNDKGEIIDSSDGKEPLSYLRQSGSLIPGLENALDGREAGYSVKVSLKPSEAYGEYDEELVQSMPLESFEGVENLEPGMPFQAQTTEGHDQIIFIKEVKENEVIIDANHPLAGKNLHFDVSVENVREASAEEIDHGHVH